MADNDSSRPKSVGKQRRPRTPGQASSARLDEHGLSVFEERFCAAIAAGSTQADAYLAADPSRVGKVKDKSVREMASHLAARENIAERIRQLRDELRKESNYTLKEAMREAGEGMEIARQEGSASAFVAAVALRAKLNGLMVEDRKNARRPYQEASEEELDAAIASAQAELAAPSSLH